MRTRIALSFAVVAFAWVLGVVPRADGTPVDQSFIFHVGTNTFSGTLLTNCIGPACDVERLHPVRFDFTIPAHTELVGFTPEFFSNDFMQFWFSGAVSGEVTWDPFGVAVGFGSTCLEVLCIALNLPAGPGSSHVENNPWSRGPHPEFFEGPFGGDFRFDFTVARVPEPSARFLLLGTGLAGLGGFAWWRRRN